jgi:hypothetical protein
MKRRGRLQGLLFFFFLLPFSFLLACSRNAPPETSPAAAAPPAAAPPSVAAAPAPGDTWKDPTSGLTWQAAPTGGPLKWAEAQTHCASLRLGGFNDWRLPTISELRSLVRGCPATQNHGSCGVTDSCTTSRCWKDACKECAGQGGPGPGGAYWPSELSGDASWCWSSSPVSDADGAWSVGFGDGQVGRRYINIPAGARCVR